MTPIKITHLSLTRISDLAEEPFEITPVDRCSGATVTTRSAR